MSTAEAEAKRLSKFPPGEPVFVLRAQDVLAPQVVRHWVELFRALRLDGSESKSAEAIRCAESMEKWTARIVPGGRHRGVRGKVRASLWPIAVCLVGISVAWACWSPGGVGVTFFGGFLPVAFLTPSYLKFLGLMVLVRTLATSLLSPFRSLSN